MNYKNQIGLHLRLKDCLLKLIEQAKIYNISSFQFFLTSHELNNRYITLNKSDQQKFLQAKRNHFDDLYIHSSYWINPATCKKISSDISKKMLKREIELVKKLEIATIILHPGSAISQNIEEHKNSWKEKGISNVARMLNELLKLN